MIDCPPAPGYPVDIEAEASVSSNARTEKPGMGTRAANQDHSAVFPDLIEFRQRAMMHSNANARKC
jgi:hypothetical protein